MLPAIKFDNQAVLETNKIRNVTANRRLSFELKTHATPCAQALPNAPLRIRHVAPQTARKLDLIHGAFRLRPSPRVGRADVSER